MSAAEIVGETIITKSGEVKSAEHLEGKLVGLYFSALWCPPCRAFSAKFGPQYTEWTAAGKNIEIVFVSSDQDQKGFDSYWGEHQPWASIAFSNAEQRRALQQKYQVSGIPCLVIIKPDGTTITTKGVQEYYQSGSECVDKWTAQI
jgi:nucleoredoxin